MALLLILEGHPEFVASESFTDDVGHPCVQTGGVTSERNCTPYPDTAINTHEAVIIRQVSLVEVLMPPMIPQ